MGLIPKLSRRYRPGKPYSYAINVKNRPQEAYHLQFERPISWSYARDVQNAIIKKYQHRHHFPRNTRHVLPPTFMTLRLHPVFTLGRHFSERPSRQDRKLLEGLPQVDGWKAETRMAWERDFGWMFHGPGQIHFWMVADLEDWAVFGPLKVYELIV